MDIFRSLPEGTTVLKTEEGFNIRFPNTNKHSSTSNDRFSQKQFVRPNEQTSNDKRVQINIDEKYFGLIIGKNGYGNQKLKENHNCEYETNKEGQIFIKFPNHIKPDIKKIKDEINSIIKRHEIFYKSEPITREEGTIIIGKEGKQIKELSDKFKVIIAINQIDKTPFMTPYRDATLTKNEDGDFIIEINNVSFKWYLKLEKKNILDGDFPTEENLPVSFDKTKFPRNQYGTIKVGNTYFKNTLWNFKRFTSVIDIRPKDYSDANAKKNVEDAIKAISKIRLDYRASKSNEID